MSTCFRIGAFSIYMYFSKTSIIGVGVIFAIITLVIYLLLAPCACCRCCRKSPVWCCARERKKLPGGISRRAKLFLFSSSALYMVWYIVDTSLLAHKIPNLTGNAKGFVCDGSELLVDTLQGTNGMSSSFMGLDQMEIAVGDLRESLDPDGDVLNQITTSVTSSSSDLRASVEDLLSELTMLHDNLALEGNRIIGHYECVFCFVWCTHDGNTGPITTGLSHRGNSLIHDPSKSRLMNAIERIRIELNDALENVDKSIKENLTGEKMEDTREALEKGKVSIRKFANDLDQNLIKPFIDAGSGLLRTLKYLDLAAVVVVSIMVLPTVLFICSLVWVFWKRRGQSNPSSRPLLLNNSADRLPVPRKPWLVSTSWCITFLFCFVIFLLSGVASIIAYLESSACKIATHPTDLTSRLASRLVGERERDGGEILSKLTAECVVDGKKARSFARVINLKIDEDTEDGEDEPNQIKRLEHRVNRDLDRMETGVGEKRKKFADNADIVSFLKQFGDYGDIFLRLDLDGVPLALGVPGLEAQLESALTGIASCEGKGNLSLSGPFGRFIRARFDAFRYPIDPDAPTFSLPGANDFSQLLDTAGIGIGVRSPAATCPAKFTNLNLVADPIGQGFQTLMREKMEVVNKVDFVCNQRGPEGMVVRRCNFEQWREYLRATHSSLGELVVKIDEAQEAFQGEVVASVRRAFEDSVIPRLETLANGMDCNYIHEKYVSMARNLCEFHAPAMHSTAMGWLMFGLMCWVAIMVEFWIWRYLKDYWTLVEEDDSGAFYTPPENPLDNTLIMSGGETPPLRETREFSRR